MRVERWQGNKVAGFHGNIAETAFLKTKPFCHDSENDYLQRKYKGQAKQGVIPCYPGTLLPCNQKTY